MKVLVSRRISSKRNHEFRSSFLSLRVFDNFSPTAIKSAKSEPIYHKLSQSYFNSQNFLPIHTPINSKCAIMNTPLYENEQFCQDNIIIWIGYIVDCFLYAVAGMTVVK